MEVKDLTRDYKETPTYSFLVILLQGIGFTELHFVPVREVASLSSSLFSLYLYNIHSTQDISLKRTIAKT